MIKLIRKFISWINGSTPESVDFKNTDFKDFDLSKIFEISLDLYGLLKMDPYRIKDYDSNNIIIDNKLILKKLKFGDPYFKISTGVMIYELMKEGISEHAAKYRIAHCLSKDVPPIEILEKCKDWRYWHDVHLFKESEQYLPW